MKKKFTARLIKDLFLLLLFFSLAITEISFGKPRTKNSESLRSTRTESPLGENGPQDRVCAIQLGDYYCSGTFHEPNLILTATHCLNGALSGGIVPNLNKVDVHCGAEVSHSLAPESLLADPEYVNNRNAEISFEWRSQEKTVKKSQRYHEVANDAGLIFLKKNKRLSAFVKATSKSAVGISADDVEIARLSKNGRCTFYGFGARGTRVSLTSMSVVPLNQMEALIQKNKFQSHRLIGIFDAQIESGDSGGPLFCLNDDNKFIQIGIASHATKGDSKFEKISSTGMWLKENSPIILGNVAPPIPMSLLVPGPGGSENVLKIGPVEH